MMMAPNPGTTRDEAAAAAVRWLIALQEEPGDPSLRACFEAWRVASPANASAWAETTRVYTGIGELPTTRLSRRSHRPTRRAALGVAAAVAASLAGVTLPGAWLRFQADHRTGTAEVRTVRLEDGSTVHLGPSSALEIAFSATERRIRSLRGVVFFEVMPDAARPFRVEAGETLTTALGTRFEVRFDDGNADIAVCEGRVRVDQQRTGPLKSELLVAGQTVGVTAAGEIARGALAPDQVAAWLDGRLIARDRPFGEVIDDLRPYYYGFILLTDRTLAARTLTGVYDLTNPPAALQAIASAHGATVRQISPWLLVVSAG